MIDKLSKRRKRRESIVIFSDTENEIESDELSNN